MKAALKMFVVLTLISLLSGALLASFDNYTASRIEENRIKNLKQAISEVLPAHDYYDELTLDSKTVYIGRLKNSDKPVGLAFKIAGNGFQGKISMMVGIKPDFLALTGLKVLEQIETPGLGTKIVEDPSQKRNPFWFPEQFSGASIETGLELVKNRSPSKTNEIQAITGATISSQSVIRIINDQLKEMKQTDLLDQIK